VEDRVAAIRTKTEREAALAVVAELDRQGYSQSAIAERLGCSQPTVSYDLKTLRKRYQESQQANHHAATAEKLAQLRDLKVEAHEAWEHYKARGILHAEFLNCLTAILTLESQLLGLIETNGKKPVLDSGVDWSPMTPAAPPAPKPPPTPKPQSVLNITFRPLKVATTDAQENQA
jgi:predicted transcriptional regulator